MDPNQPSHKSIPLASSDLLSLVGRLSNSNPEGPDPPKGPWGPVIRRAAERVRLIVPGPNPRWQVFAPIAPQYWLAFAQALALEVVDRATLMQEVADALPQTGQTHGIIIVGGFISRFVGDCGTGKLKRPLPPPRRHGEEDLTSDDLLVMAAQFQHDAAATDHEGLRREFSKAGDRLAELAVGRLQSAAAHNVG